MGVPVVVPSYRRERCLSRKTLPLLYDRGVDPADVTVVVGTGPERDSYAEAIGAAGLPLPEIVVSGCPGSIRDTRNFIATTWSGEIMEVDDDLTDVMRYVDPKTTEPVKDLPALFAEGFAVARNVGATLWGIYPVPNPYFMRPGVVTDLRYIEAGIFGTTLVGEPYQLVTLDDKEDYERSIRHYLHDGVIARIDWYTFRANYYTEPGGLQATRTPERIDWSARELARRYPDLASVNTAKKSRPYTEVRLRDHRKPHERDPLADRRRAAL